MVHRAAPYLRAGSSRGCPSRVSLGDGPVTSRQLRHDGLVKRFSVIVPMDWTVRCLDLTHLRKPSDRRNLWDDS